VIRVSDVTKIYSRERGPAVDSLSFDVGDGEILGFVGLNGAGKTTTIRMAVGVTIPTSGNISIDGHDIVGQKIEASRNLGWVPEFPNFEPNSKASSLMHYFAGYYGIGGADAERKSAELLKSVGLADSADRKLRDYSQGMKKRFSLAASQLSDPKNYLFDEILNGLDPEGIRFFRRLMLDFRKQKKAVLLSSHILVEVENLADKVVVIHKGKLVKTITASELANVGGVTLRIKAKNFDERGLAYLKDVGEVRVEGGTVFLSLRDADPAQVNTELVKMGYDVTEFSQQKEGLEDYFLGLVGGSNK